LEEYYFSRKNIDVFSSEAARCENVIYPIILDIYKHYGEMWHFGKLIDDLFIKIVFLSAAFLNSNKNSIFTSNPLSAKMMPNMRDVGSEAVLANIVGQLAKPLL